MPDIKVNDKGNIQFRHPLAPSRVVCRGVGKLSKTAKGIICDDLAKLFLAKPALMTEAPEGLHPTALNIWFKPLSKPSKKHRDVSKLKREDIADRDNSYIRETIPSVPQYELNKSRLQVAELEAELKMMRKKLSTQGLAEDSVTLKECLTHFEAHVRCKRRGGGESDEAKKMVLGRVRKLVEALGENRPHCEITQDAIELAVEGLLATPKGPKSTPKPMGDTERRNVLREAKRFFKELSVARPPLWHGLGNPTIGIKPGSGRTGKKPVLDPKAILKSKKLSPYWKAFTAVLGYAGLRPSEAANLMRDSIDQKADLIRVRPSEFKPTLKNDRSDRDVRPFGNVWDYLKAYKPTHEALVFDRVGHPSGPSWFEDRDGAPRAVNLPTAYADAIREATGETIQEPCRKLRRFWVTKMRSKGLAHLVETFGGHSEDVSKAKYTNYDEMMRTAKVPKI